MVSNLDETVFRGRVSNGTIVLTEEVRLPEGAEVEVRLSPNGEPQPPAEPASETDPAAETETIWQKMVRLAQSFPPITDLPEDLAANHDHYLHGLPKRQ